MKLAQSEIIQAETATETLHKDMPDKHTACVRLHDGPAGG